MYKQKLTHWISENRFLQDPVHVVGIFLIAAFVVGLILLLISRSWSRRRRRWLLIEAEITDFQTTTHKDDDGSTMTLYAPEYTYSFGEKTYVHSSNTYSRSTSYNVGDRVPILIDPERPEKCGLRVRKSLAS